MVGDIEKTPAHERSLVARTSRICSGYRRRRIGRYLVYVRRLIRSPATLRSTTLKARGFGVRV
jgi:hypothetical protein